MANLDEHYANDRLTSLIDSSRYSADGQLHNRPNPSKIPFEGDVRKNVASYRNAVERYRKFRDAAGDSADLPETEEVRATPATDGVEEETDRWTGLERDMQAALRMEIGQLEQGLTHH